jgi:hypothetical protein
MRRVLVYQANTTAESLGLSVFPQMTECREQCLDVCFTLTESVIASAQ